MRINGFVCRIVMCFTLALTIENTVCAQYFPRQEPGPLPTIQSSIQPYSRSLTDSNSPNGGQARQSFPDDSASTMVSRRNARASSDSLARLSRLDSMQRFMPQMFADSPAAPLSVTLLDGRNASSELPLAGAAHRLKPAENNRALPQERIIFQYQLAVNALDAQVDEPPDAPVTKSHSLAQYTVGFEKVFLDGNASIDVRMPFTNQFNFQTDQFGVEGGSIGNLNVKLKFALLVFETSCLSVGSGLDLPTGSQVLINYSGLTDVIENDALFLQPFIAYERRRGDWFLNGFTSLDVPLSEYTYKRRAFMPFDDKVGEQTLGSLSIGAGRWLFFNPNRSFYNGTALLSELHYTSTLQDTHSATSPPSPSALISNVSNRSDYLNLTVGSQFQFGLSALRLGFVQPLRSKEDRLFDHEFNVQFNRLF